MLHNITSCSLVQEFIGLLLGGRGRQHLLFLQLLGSQGCRPLEGQEGLAGPAR